MAFPLGGELGDRIGAEPHAAPQDAQLGFVVGKQMGSSQPSQLKPVLKSARKPVRRRQGRRVVAADIPPRGERLERGERRGASQHHVSAAVHQLQELHRELNVAQPAGTQLDFAVNLTRRDVLLDPASHCLHIGDEVVAVGGRPHPRQRGADVVVSERTVAGARACLEQRLELPRLRPARVVVHVAVEGAHERTALTLGPQSRINLPDRTLGRCGDARVDQRLSQSRGGLKGGTLISVADGLSHEHHVDVAHVVEFSRATLS
ncbi:unannotated protein [freshwater metagenome]|uniref:Unannotated protein n=1 Tax=freshwater metagenome TaxID=449393 RepID=A0A6J7JVE5_9ZZZZ